MAPKTNTSLPSSPLGESFCCCSVILLTRIFQDHLDASLESRGSGPPGFSNSHWTRYCQIKAALKLDRKRSPPLTPTSQTGLPGGCRTSHPLPHPSSPTSASANRAIQSVVTTPFHPQLAYSSKGIQTTPSLVTKCPSPTVEISSESEDERIDGTATKTKNGEGNLSLTGDRPKRRVIIIDSESSASDDDRSPKMPGAYPSSESFPSQGPVTPVYVPRWLISPNHTPTPAQRQRRFRRSPLVQIGYSPIPLETAVDSDSEPEVVGTGKEWLAQSR
jgi:hypothetical protein